MTFHPIATPLKLNSDNFTPEARTPWAGTLICAHYKLPSIQKNIGESWDISCHPSFPSLILENPYHTSLKEVEENTPFALMGPKKTRFPLLIKLLNSGNWLPYIEQLNNYGLNFPLDINHYELLKFLEISNNAPCIQKIVENMMSKQLSIQVHPKEGDFQQYPPKTEAWYILDHEPGAGVYVGINKEINYQEFNFLLSQEEDLSKIMNFIPVKKGDLFYIPSGTLHAIGAGITLYEIQQSSESTFRAYDWKRVYQGTKRELHLKEVLKSTTITPPYSETLINKLKRKKIHLNEHISQLFEEEFFSSYEIIADPENSFYLGPFESFIAITLLKGNLEIEGKIFQKGDPILLPYDMKQALIRTLTPSQFILSSDCPIKFNDR